FMVIIDDAVVLSKTDFKENDRLISLYSKEHGRIAVRFPSVNKPNSKLKAFCEPFTQACYRIYYRRNADIGSGTGGKIISVFAGIRKDYKKTSLALEFCQFAKRLTPEHQPNILKYNLLVESLKEVEAVSQIDSRYFYMYSCAFVLRFMHTAGFGLDKPVLGLSKAFWDKIHNTPLSELSFEGEEQETLDKTRYIVNRFLERYLDKPLQNIHEYNTQKATSQS
ncbi:MAG: DNA repair protein RecO, partial [Elusimicrobiaceae bacterium]|nr:DNA repair protein RecO [Elusimicrobiaceae bacterium]